MRPYTGALPRAVRLHVPKTLPQKTLCGARNYARTAEALQMNQSPSSSIRPMLRCPAFQIASDQRRWISRKYVQKQLEAKKEWSDFADEIEAGKRKSFAQHLEERGLLHDVVG